MLFRSGYVTLVLARCGVSLRQAIVVAIAFCALQLLLLVQVFDIAVEREILGRAAWALLGH